MTNKNIKLTTYTYPYGQAENRIAIKCETKEQACALRFMLDNVGITVKDADKCTKTLQIRLPKDNIVVN